MSAMKTTDTEKPARLTGQEQKDLKVLALFTSVYCRCKHGGDKAPLVLQGPEWQGLKIERYPCCSECRDFLGYAFMRRLRCPLDPKPSCKHCEIHCYRTGHRERVREIMRFSGQYLVKRGRIDLLWHLWF